MNRIVRVHSIVAGGSLWTEPLTWLDAVALSTSLRERGFIGDIVFNDRPRHLEIRALLEGRPLVIMNWGSPCDCEKCVQKFPRGQCRAAIVPAVAEAATSEDVYELTDKGWQQSDQAEKPNHEQT